MGRAQSDTYSSLFTKSDNVNLDETFDRKSVFVHVLKYSCKFMQLAIFCKNICAHGVDIHRLTLFDKIINNLAVVPHSCLEKADV